MPGNTKGKTPKEAKKQAREPNVEAQGRVPGNTKGKTPKKAGKVAQEGMVARITSAGDTFRNPQGATTAGATQVMRKGTPPATTVDTPPTTVDNINAQELTTPATVRNAASTGASTPASVGTTTEVNGTDTNSLCNKHDADRSACEKVSDDSSGEGLCLFTDAGTVHPYKTSLGDVPAG